MKQTMSPYCSLADPNPMRWAHLCMRCMHLLLVNCQIFVQDRRMENIVRAVCGPEDEEWMVRKEHDVP